MSIHPKKLGLFIFIITFSIAGCNKADDQNDSQNNSESNIISITSVSQITETSCTLTYQMNFTNLNQLFVQISKSNSFDQIDKEISIEHTSGNKYIVDGLNGLTEYFVRLKVIMQDGTIIMSNSEFFRTNFTSESVSIQTDDGFLLSAKIQYLASEASPKPCIIFMHELGDSKKNYLGTEVVSALIAKNYVCAMFDFRGHGSSTALSDLMKLFNNKSYIATDLKTVLAYLKNHEHIDETKFALVGASLGAIMAIAGNGYEEVKTSVSLSGLEDGIYKIFLNLQIQSAFYIAAQNDYQRVYNINYSAEAQSMYNKTTEPRKLMILPGTDHGTDMFGDNVNQEIIDWITTHL